MKYYVEETMKQDHLGLSSGLEYVPGNYANEALYPWPIAKQYNGVYFTHMRNESAIRETIQHWKKRKYFCANQSFKSSTKIYCTSTWSFDKAFIFNRFSPTINRRFFDIYPYNAFSTLSSIPHPHKSAMEQKHMNTSKTYPR